MCANLFVKIFTFAVRGGLKQRVLLCLCPLALFAETQIIGGSQTFRYRVTGARKLLDNFYEYEQNGNSQKVIKREAGSIVVENRAVLTPFKSTVRFPTAGNLESTNLEMTMLEFGVLTSIVGNKKTVSNVVKKTPLSSAASAALRKIALRETKGVRFRFEAVERIAAYVRRRVKYQLGVSSHPLTVLKQGKAFCDGYANAVVFLLRSINIPAMRVNCYIPPGHMWGLGPEGSGGYHSYVSVFYEDAGWVSSDPQMSIHFVDPFHIANYPWKGLRITQLEEQDNRNILGLKKGPPGQNNFFQRQTGSGGELPVLVGRIIDPQGRVVSDSVRNDNWVFVRRERGSHPGIRILETGDFAVTAPAGKPFSFYYSSRQGLYLTVTDKLTAAGRKAAVFDFRGRASVKIIQAGKGKKLYRWLGKDLNSYQPIETDKEGRIYVLAKGEPLILSRLTDTASPRRLFAADQLPVSSREIPFEELPFYFNPDKFYIEFQANQRGTEGALFAKAVNQAGRFYQPIRLNADGSGLLSLPDKGFDTITVSGSGLFSLHRADFKQGRRYRCEPFKNERDLIRIKAVGKRNLSLVKKISGRSYAVIGSIKLNRQGAALLEIERQFFAAGAEYLISVGGRVDQKSAAVTEDLLGKVLEF